jgi:hypothetical protein
LTGNFEVGEIWPMACTEELIPMASSHNFTNIPGMTEEMREGVIAAFDALSNWRDEVETANERCLGKVLGPG